MSPLRRSARYRGESSQYHSRKAGSWLDTKKKTIRASEQKEAERAAWRKIASNLSSRDLVFVDETGSHLAMTPVYAYAPRGQRAYGTVPRKYGATMTLMASLSLSRMGAAFILDGAADSTALEVYVEQILAQSQSWTNRDPGSPLDPPGAEGEASDRSQRMPPLVLAYLFA